MDMHGIWDGTRTLVSEKGGGGTWETDGRDGRGEVVVSVGCLAG